MDRGAWQATVHGISKESDMTERLSLSLYIWKILSTPKILKLIQGLPWWLCGKKKKKKKTNCQCRRPGFDPWVRKIPWRRKWQPSPVFLSGKSHGQRILVGYSPWGLKRVRHDLATKQQQHQIEEATLDLQEHMHFINFQQFKTEFQNLSEIKILVQEIVSLSCRLPSLDTFIP